MANHSQPRNCWITQSLTSYVPFFFDQRYEYGDKEFIELREGVDKAFEFIGTSALVRFTFLAEKRIFLVFCSLTMCFLPWFRPTERKKV